MATGSPLPGIKATPDGQNPAVAYDRTWFFSDPVNNITANSFTITNTNNTTAVACVAGRPAVQITDGNTGATDKTTYFVPTACIIPQANYVLRARFSVYMTTTTMDCAFGLGVVGTDPIGTDPTNHVMVRKLSADSVFSLRARKASGTAFIVALNMPAVVASQWYDFDLWILHGSSDAAGYGRAQVFLSTQGNAPFDASGQQIIVGQFPDTVAMAPFWAQRAGATDTANCAVDYFSFQQEFPGVHF